MFEKKGKHLLIFFILLGGIALYFLLDRMVIRRNEILNTRYTEKKFIELIEELIAEQVFKIEGDKVILDEMALSNRRLGKKTETKVRNSLPFLYAQKGKVLFDRMALSITSNGALREETLIRGRFLDRNGIVLARSVLNGNERVSNQKREYIYGPVFYPIIGHWNLVYGKKYLEKEMDAYLSGKKHSPARKNISETIRPLEVGDDIVLTLDSRAQKVAFRAMRDRKGAVVVLDVKTGEVLAAVSTPSFDPNTREVGKWREAFMDQQERPYDNRAFSVTYPPGSTFKTVVATAWIEDDTLEKDNKIVCTNKKNGYNISDIHAHGQVDFNKAFVVSCNQFFSEIGVMLGQKVLECANRFGFNKDFNLMPRMEDHHYRSEKSLAFSWHNYKGNNGEIETYRSIDFKRNKKIVAQGAIGQNLITATPLQMALIASTIANKGILMNPSIIKGIKSGDGRKVFFSSGPLEIGRILKGTTIDKLKRLMEEVMEKGTGKDVKKIFFEDGKYTTSPRNKDSKSIPVAGKTGTAEVGDKNGNGNIDPNEKPHSWFIGFAPADQPRVAIAVIAENQGFGSLTAAPIAMEVLSEALN